ncbi:MAG TPA: SDR family oxidoreductase, partial [Anaerolineae bacterium]|nr:SDR family oxidoreductase [Anaerolineae bacterium]
WQRILDANLVGAYLAAHYSLPLLARDAHLLFLGAVSERMRLPRLSAYAAAKAGLEAFVEVLGKEERKRRVTLVRPAAVDTPLWDKVPFKLPAGAMSPDETADRILDAYRDGHRGVLDL